MIRIGNFFFKYRNLLFIFLYLSLLIPSAPIFKEDILGGGYYYYPIVIGLVVTVTGQLIRGVTISLAYIIRGGKDKKVYAEELVTRGMFAHCRNPLYVGNILMLLGLGVMKNSLLFVAIVMPIFIFIYHAIVLAEENFLERKFGSSFMAYCSDVSRWVIRFRGLARTLRSMHFNGKRWLVKEYNTQAIWLIGVFAILFLGTPQLTKNDTQMGLMYFSIAVSMVGIFYFFVRYQKKSGSWTTNEC